MDNLEQTIAPEVALQQSNEVLGATVAKATPLVAAAPEASMTTSASSPSAAVAQPGPAPPASKKKKRVRKSRGKKYRPANPEDPARRPHLRADEKIFSPYPLVYSWSVVMFEKLYHEHAHINYADRIAEKGEDEMWTAFYKRLQAARIAAEGAKKVEEAVGAESGACSPGSDIIYLSGLTPQQTADSTTLPSIQHEATSPGAQSSVCSLLPADPSD